MFSYIKGVFLACTAGLLWALTTPATKLMWGMGVMIPSAVLARMVVVALAVGTFLYFKHPSQLRISKRNALKLFFFSILGPTGLYLGFLMSVVYLNAATALVLHYTFPVVTVLCSSAVTGERPDRFDWICTFLVTAGVACSVLTPEWKLDTAIDIRGILWGLAAVFGLAFETLLGRASFTKGGISNLALFFYSHLFGIFWSSIYITAIGSWSNFEGLPALTWCVILLPCILGCLLGFTSYYTALRYIPATMASLVASVEIIGAVILTAALTGVSPTIPELVGCAFIFIAIATDSFSKLHLEKPYYSKGARHLGRQ